MRTRLIGLSGALVLLLAAWLLQPRPGILPPDGTLIALLVGGALVGLSLRGMTTDGRRPDDHPASDAEPSRRGVRRVPLALGVLALAALAEISGGLIQREWAMSQHGQALLLAAGLLLLAVGLCVDPWRLPRVPRGEIAALLTVLALAFGLRAWELDRIWRFVDEIHYLDAITRLWDAPTTPLLVPFSDVTAFTWLFPYLQQGPVALLGPSLESFRLTSALFGTATVAAVYLFTRLLSGSVQEAAGSADGGSRGGIALVAALLLAVLPPHLQFSRIALSNIADPLFGTLALGLLLSSQTTGSRTTGAVGGIALGLTQYFYEGGRLLFPAVALLWIVGVVLAQRRGALNIQGERHQGAIQRTDSGAADSSEVIQGVPAPYAAPRTPYLSLITHYSSLRTFLFAFLLVAAPVYYTLAARGLLLSTRLNAMSLTPEILQDYADNYPYLIGLLVWRPWLAYVSLPESGWFYGGNTGLVLWYVAPLLLIGGWVALWRVRRPGIALLLLWGLLATLGNLLMRDLWFARYAVVLPALAVLMALGAGWLYRLLMPPPSPSPLRVWLGAMLLCGLALIAAVQPLYYFGDHLNVYQYQYRSAQDVDDSLLRAVQLPANTQVLLITEAVIFRVNIDAVLHFFGREDDLTIENMGLMWFTDEVMQRLDPNKNHAFFVEPVDSYVRYLLDRYYPAIPDALSSPYNVPIEYQFWMYYFPRGTYQEAP